MYVIDFNELSKNINFDVDILINYQKCTFEM